MSVGFNPNKFIKESKFNSIEKRNITTIEAYQKKKGWRS